MVPPIDRRTFRKTHDPMTTIHTLGQPTSLTDARLQLHHAAQAVSAAADARLDRRDDDSQSNLGYAASLPGVVTHPLPDGRVFGLRLSNASLVVLDDGVRLDHHLPIDGKTLDELLAWVNARLADGPKAEFRGYDMPDHPVARGDQLDLPDAEQLAALHAWTALGHDALTRAIADRPHAGPPRLWPHHFDLGAIVLLQPGDDPAQSKSIGVGMSLGDASYDQPYFYVNPYGLPDDAPDLPWVPDAEPAAGWTGLVLTGERIVDRGDLSMVDRFLERAIESCRALLVS